MPGCARRHQLSESLTYHVYSRSNGRVRIFHDGDDFKYFRGLLTKYASIFCLKVYHWVIMSNHYHLLLEIEIPEEISSCMSGLARSYTYYYHKKYKTNGFLWQGRFKMQAIEKENYLLACGRYIERNPVRARMVSDPAKYAYSSSGFYCLGTEDGLTIEDPYFETFGTDVLGRRQGYARFLQDFDVEEEQSFHNIEEPQGSLEFKRRLIKDHGRHMPRRKGRAGHRFVV